MRLSLLGLALLGLFSGCAEEVDVSPPVKNAIDSMEALNEQVAREQQQKTAELMEAEESAIPKTGTYDVRFSTTVGDFKVRVHRDWAPRGAHRFYQLVKAGFFNNSAFFRVVPDFVVQFGLAADPLINQKWATTIPDDPVKKSNKRGYITFATSGPDSRTTQVFINFRDNANLDSQGFAPFGEVIEGMDVVDSISAVHGQEPDQSKIRIRGNAYLKEHFPRLDYIKSAAIISEDLVEELPPIQQNTDGGAGGPATSDSPKADGEPSAADGNDTQEN